MCEAVPYGSTSARRKSDLDKDQEPQTRTIEVDREFDRIDGFRFLDPRPRAIAPRIRRVMDKLLEIVVRENLEERVTAMSDEVRAAITDVLRERLTEARELIAEAQEMQRFFSPVTIATLRGWGRHEGCPIRIHARRDNAVLVIGRDEDEEIRVTISRELLRPHPGFAAAPGPDGRRMN